jgi:hypothetical protein
LPNPAVVSRRCTSSSAAAFSETTSTRLPACSRQPTMFATVCDLPVPGGPLSTKLCPATAAATAARWLASASSTSGTSSGGASSSIRAGGIGAKVSCRPVVPAASARTTGCSTMCGSFSYRS